MRVKEDEALIEELQEQLKQYKSQLSQAQDRVKSLVDQVEKRKKENEMLKKTLQRNRPPTITPSFHKVGAGTGTAPSIIIEPAPYVKGSRKGTVSPTPVSTTNTSDTKLLTIAQGLKSKYSFTSNLLYFHRLSRLAETEEKLSMAQAEVARLQKGPVREVLRELPPPPAQQKVNSSPLEIVSYHPMI